jgi:hypothetical protein
VSAAIAAILLYLRERLKRREAYLDSRSQKGRTSLYYYIVSSVYGFAIMYYVEGVYLGVTNGYKTRGNNLIVCAHLV